MVGIDEDSNRHRNLLHKTVKLWMHILAAAEIIIIEEKVQYYRATNYKS